MDPLRLARGDLSLLLSPGRGGALAEFTWRGHHLMRPGDPSGSAPPTDLASFPMLPVCNRVRDNRLRLGAASWPVEPNMPGQPLHLHGTGWTSAWRVAVQAPDRAVLELASNTPPWRYLARQSVRLDEDGLRIHLRVENQAEEAMPFGLGLHPHLPEPVSVRFAARRVWLMDRDLLPSEPIGVPPELDFTASRPVPAAFRNLAYEGWNGIAEVHWPERDIAVTLQAPALPWLLYFRPRAGGFVALEPMSHLPDAASHEDAAALGWRALATGEAMEAEVAFVVHGR